MKKLENLFEEEHNML